MKAPLGKIAGWVDIPAPKIKISVIHPSRRRPIMALETIMNWLTKSDTDLEYIFSLDNDDNSTYEFGKGDLQSFGVSVIRNNNKSAIDAINNAAKIAKGDILIVVSDDFDCPEHWDTLLLNALEGKSDFLVKTQDGLQKTLITLPIMDREYYNRFGYIYCPDYLHMHCDEEMTIVGHMLGKVITLGLLFPHNHYTTGKMAMDEINIKNNSTWAHGQATLDRRAKDNFGIANPLIKRDEIIWK